MSRTPGRNPTRSRVPSPGPLALLLVAALAAPMLANGGTVRISEAPVGPWRVTVYSSPTPLRTGEIDISALVQDSADALVDLPIAVEATAVRGASPAIRREATRGQATNKLFKAAKFEVAAPGQWRFVVTVGPDGAGRGGQVSFQATVAKSTILDRPYLLAALVLLPLVVLGWLWLGRDGDEDPADRISPGSPR